VIPLIELQRQTAADTLYSISPFKYKYFVERLLANNSPALDIPAILATESENPSIVFIEKSNRDYINTDLDVQIYLAEADDIGGIAAALPTDQPVYAFIYQDELIPLFHNHFDMELEGVRIGLFASGDSVNKESAGAVELFDEHDASVRESESPQVRRNWDFCKEFRDFGFRAWGVFHDGKLVSFCSMGPDSMKNKPLKIQEVSYIYTETAYRGKGYGKKVLQKASMDILDGGGFPYYSVVSTNSASLNTAKYGYKLISHTAR
jgi:GNAT superfamily N-acetyltransferase